MSINIQIDKKEMKVNVIRDDIVIKSEDIDKDSFKDYMTELAGDDIDMLRKVAKLFKPSCYEFKNIKG